MSQENSQVYTEEDEIDLRELWKTLIKRKRLIIIVTAVITAMAIAYSLLARPIYEVKSNVEIGYIGSSLKQGSEFASKNLVAEAKAVVKILNIVFNVEDGIKTEEEFVSKVSSITANKKLADFIEIKTEAVSNDEAVKKNKEVLLYLQGLYQKKLDQYFFNTKNSIENTKRTIFNINAFEVKNLQEQIKLLRTQKIVQIDEKIKKLKEQDIVKLQKRISLLKTQDIVKIDEKIKFLEEKKVRAVQSKIDFYSEKLKEYIKAVDKLFNKKELSSDAEFIASMQMVNYQNLILNSQNKIEDLKMEKETIQNETIIALQRKKQNIQEVSIRDLELGIDNIKNITIVNLQIEKENISNETIRKLQHQIDVDLVNKKIQLNEQIEKLNYSMSEQNVQNSRVIGEYIIKDYPFKPKKKLIVMVAFITGLMLSVFLAFFLEFIQSGRQEKEYEVESMDMKA